MEHLTPFEAEKLCRCCWRQWALIQIMQQLKPTSSPSLNTRTVYFYAYSASSVDLLA
jgi:hypothetical protein